MSTSKAYHHGHLAAAVLTAARRLLDSTPAEQLSVRELAREAGVSHAAPYRHFGDREGFLTALSAHCFAEFLAAQQAAFDAAGPGGRLLAVGEAYVQYGVAHPHAFALVYNAALATPQDPPQALAPLGERHRRLLHAAVADALAAGQLPAHAGPEDVGAALWSLVHGLTALTANRYLDPARVPAILTALLLRPS